MPHLSITLSKLDIWPWLKMRMTFLPILLLWTEMCFGLTPSGRPIIQTFIQEPEDVSFRVGSHAVLPCQVKNKKGTVQWTKDGFGLGIDRNLTGFDRYKMVGSEEEGVFSLDIFPIMLEDDAEYQCQLNGAKDAAPAVSNVARLMVLVEPEDPVIINGNELKTVENREIIIECLSRGGKPAANIMWTLNGVHIDSGRSKYTIEETKEKIAGTLREKTTSKLKFTAKKVHHNSTIKCSAQNSIGTTPTNDTIQITVEYAPEVKLDQDHEPVFEGEEVTFMCKAHANPPEMTYIWYLNEEVVAGIHGNKYQIPSMPRIINSKVIKCEVTNAVGKNMATKTLNINYAPKFTVLPSDVIGDPNQQVYLSCRVDGNPRPTYRWFRKGNMQKVIEFGSNLRIQISSETIGKYICLASVKGFSEVSASAQVLMRGKPKILRSQSHSIQFGGTGESVKIECHAFSIPSTEPIQWTIFNDPIDPSNSHYTVMEESMAGGIKSTLVIRGATDLDFGADYKCRIKNPYGQDSFTISLKKRQDLPLIIIIVSTVIFGAILTVATILIVIRCHGIKKTSKTETLLEPLSDRSEILKQAGDFKYWDTPDSMKSQKPFFQYPQQQMSKEDQGQIGDMNYKMVDLDNPLFTTNPFQYHHHQQIQNMNLSKPDVSTKYSSPIFTQPSNFSSPFQPADRNSQLCNAI